jgi:hypothetical protein
MLEPSTDFDPRVLLGSFRRDDLFFPRYRALTSGAWSLRVAMIPAARGYWGEVYRLEGALILMGPGEGGQRSWMSMLPCEIESQEVGLNAACGHTVVFGLGMGWVAANAALRPDVERVSVIERDPDVIAMALATGVFEQLPAAARAKIHLIQADALSWTPGGPVDSLQADIWLSLLENGKLEAVQRMQCNVQARSVYFWGQELEIWRHACRRAGSVLRVLDGPTLRRIVSDDLGLPLVAPDRADYAQKVAAAAAWWTPRAEGWWLD